jgi:hypothetical protein
MIYQVATHKLEPLLYVDENQRFITEEQIEQAVAQGDIFPLSPDDGLNFVRSVAYLIINPENIAVAIAINMGFAEKGELPEITAGKNALAAQIYLQKNHIYADVTGSEKSMVALLDIDLKNDVVSHDIVQEINAQFEDVSPVSWKKISENVQDNWSDMDYIITQFEENDSFSLNEKIHLIPESLWENHNFILKLLDTDRALNQIPLDIAMKPTTISALSQKPRALDILWGQYYHFLFLEEKSSRDNDIWNQSYAEKENYKKFNNNEYIKANKEALKNYFLETLNSEAMLAQIKIIDNYPSNHKLAILYLLNDENKARPEVMDVVVTTLGSTSISGRQELYGSVWTFFSRSAFADGTLVAAILGKTEDLTSINSADDYIWEGWIENKEKVVDVLDSLNANDEMYSYAFDSIVRLFSNLPKALLSDKDVALRLMPKATGLYARLPDFLQYDNEVIDAFLDKAKDYQVRTLSSNHFFTLTDKEQIKKVVSLLPETMSYKNCPYTWKNDTDIVIHLKSKMFDKEYHIPPKVIEDIITDKDKCMQLINADSQCYEHLSHRMKVLPEIALSYITESYNREKETVQKIPAQAWLSKEFCLQALIHEELAAYVPQPFWNEKGFVLKVMQGIDDYNYQPEILKFAPRELVQILDGVGVIKGQYLNVIKKQLFHYELSHKIEQNYATKMDDDNEDYSARKIKI